MRAMCQWLCQVLKVTLSGSSPSAAGTPPGLESGAGRDHVGWNVSGRDHVGKVGIAGGQVTKFVGKKNKTVTPAVYMMAHDKGTVKNVAQRPWLNNAIRKFGDGLARVYRRHFSKG